MRSGLDWRLSSLFQGAMRTTSTYTVLLFRTCRDCMGNINEGRGSSVFACAQARQECARWSISVLWQSSDETVDTHTHLKTQLYVCVCCVFGGRTITYVVKPWVAVESAVQVSVLRGWSLGWRNPSIGLQAGHGWMAGWLDCWHQSNMVLWSHGSHHGKIW